MVPANNPESGGRKGKFITLEGMDGAGKSTHIPSIANQLRACGIDLCVTREPGGTALAEKIRALLLADTMDPMTETLLMFAARRDHVERVIAPALQAGRWVLCDRFTDATLAYQGAGKGIDAPLIEQLARLTHPGLMPDCTLVFDCSWDQARARLGREARPLDRFERESESFFERVRDAYRRLASIAPDRVRLIDASLPLPEVKVLVEKYIATI